MKLAVGVLLAIATIMPARAQAPDEATAAYERGVAAYERRDYKAALKEFEDSYAKTKRWEILYNIGITRRQLFHYTGAVDALRKYKEEASTHGLPDFAARAETELAQIAVFTAEVTVHVVPDGATVLLEGNEVGVTPLPGPLVAPEGERTIVVRAKGYVTKEEKIRVEPRQPRTVAVTLTLAAPIVTIRTRPPGATLEIDGKLVGVEPFRQRLEPGSHQVIARLRGYEPGRADLKVDAGIPTAATIDLPKSAPRWYQNRGVWIIAIGVVTVGAVGLAAWQYDRNRFSYDEEVHFPPDL